MSRIALRRSERGNAALELVLLTPLLLVVLSFVVFVGRLSSVQSDVHTAASDAARAASIQRDPAAAGSMARSTAAETLAGKGVSCPSPDVAVDVGQVGDGIPGGQVEVTIRCGIALADLSFFGLPGQRTVSASAISVVDRYRGGG